MSRKNMMLVISGAAFGLAGVATAATPDLDIDRAYAAELKADAAMHTSLLQGGGSGHDGWFHMGDASGNNRLNIGGLLQVRYLAGFRDDADLPLGAAAEGFTHGFEAQRGQLRAWGNVVNPQLTFQFIWDWANANGHHDHSDTAVLGSQLRDAWGQYNFEGEGSGWFVRWGQFVDPYLWEESVAPEYQLAAERSAVNEFFTPNWTQGAMFGYVGEGFSFKGTFTDGSRSSRSATAGTGATVYNHSSEADFALSARADLKLSGAWQQFDDFTSFKGSNTAFRIGGGIHWQSGGETGIGTVGFTTTDIDTLLWTIDAAYEGDGWNLYAAIVGDNVDRGPTAGGFDTSDLGLIVQGGLFVSEQAELFARYDGLFMDDFGMGPTEEDNFHFLTAGVNWYFVPESHAAKLTADLVWGFSDMSAAGGSTYNTVGNYGDTGLLGGADGEVLFRAQMQLLF